MSGVGERDAGDALAVVRDRLVAAWGGEGGRAILVGVSGPVASGKSRFSQRLRGVLEEALGTPVTHVPFDYWINPTGLPGAVYADRFFLDDFAAALECIAGGQPWMCPRYDLAKQRVRRADSRSAVVDGAQVAWQGHALRRTAGYDDPPGLHGASGTYLDPASDRLFTLVVPQPSAIYLIDGTLIGDVPPAVELG